MITNPLLKTYWIESPAIGFLGLGVTAFSRDDAFQLLSASGYVLSPEDPSIRITEGIQVADLDQNHIIPNMGPIVFRGVWFPRANR
ncbi:MAG TPA: hypothetical protein DIT64_19015 [Verrucomicrobiales bacterium]|nr:hypothetical protein [Verrucomicrobiales bacterium]